MPRYDYACTECDHRFEAVQAFTDEPLSACPVCGGRLRKLFSAVGVVFKGSGFYRNDSRPKEAAASSSDGDGAKSSAKSETKTDTKAGTSDTKTKTESKTPAAAAASSSSSTASKSA